MLNHFTVRELCGFLGFLGLHVLLAVLLVAQEFGVHALGTVISLLLLLLDAVTVLLVSLIVGSVIRRLGHPVRTFLQN